MLKIHPDSWHYKLAYHNLTKAVFASNRDLAPDLCTYVRHILKPFIAMVAIMWVLSVTPICVYSYFMYGQLENWPALVFESVSIFYVVWMLVGLIGNGILLMLLLALVVGMFLLLTVGTLGEINDWRKMRRQRTNIVVERYKAFKYKVCPLVDFTDEE